MADYSTYIEIFNQSKSSFQSKTPDPESGTWEQKPAPTIKAGSTEKGIWLKDHSGTAAGTDGKFTLTAPDGSVLTAHFECPYGAYDNKVSWEVSDGPGGEFFLSYKTKVADRPWHHNKVDKTGEPLHVHFYIEDLKETRSDVVE